MCVPSLWYYSWLKLSTVCTLVSTDEPNMMSLLIIQMMKSPKRPQTTGMSPNISPLLAVILWDESAHLGWWPSWMLIMLSCVLTDKRLQPTMWQFGRAIHCHHVSCRPHQQFQVLWPHATCILIQKHCLKFVDMLGCDVMRQWLSWLDTCSVVLQARHWQHTCETCSARYMPHK